VQTTVGEEMVPQIPPGSRRLSSRVESGASVWVYWECNGDRDLSPVKDLSVGGLFIETPKTKRPGATANLHFLVQEGQIRADAVVRHVQPGGGMGLKFKAMSEKDRPNLAALMRRLRSLS
jgi:PilZ domain